MSIKIFADGADLAKLSREVYTGIYKISSIAHLERVYVGSSVNVFDRWRGHFRGLHKGDHFSRKLQRHFNKYGGGDLVFSILLECAREDLIANEQHFLDLLQPYFNTRKYADSQLGVKHSEATKRKISLAKKGCDYWSGRKHNDELKQKMRAAKLGRKLSLKTRSKLSAAKIGNTNAVGNKNRLGKSHSFETRKKISDSLKQYYAEGIQ